MNKNVKITFDTNWKQILRDLDEAEEIEGKKYFGYMNLCVPIRSYMKALDAVKRRIHKKPESVEVFIDDVLFLGICPECKSGVTSDMNYCNKCGQALDWSDDK